MEKRHAPRATAWLLGGVLAAPAVAAAQPVSSDVAEAQRRLAVSAQIERSRLTGLARFVRVDRGYSVAATAAATASPEEQAHAFFARHGRAFGLREPSDLRLVGAARRDDLGMHHVRFGQWHRGLPVTGAEAIVHLQGEAVTAVNGRTLDVDGLARIGLIPAIDSEHVGQTARALVEARALEVQRASAPRLELFNRGLFDGRPVATRLAWFVTVRAPRTLEYVWVDAQTGDVLLHFNQQPDARDRRIYDAGNGWDVPGTLVRGEGGAATGDLDADAAYQFAGDTYDYFFSRHGRDSVDDAGQTLELSVHYGIAYGNASWDPETEQMWFGDGTALADDVVAHEITHGVTQHSANLYYYREPGALSESLSDIFGESVDLLNGAGTDTVEARWLEGEDWPEMGPVRDMMDPNALGDPGKVSDPQVVCSESDYGGVHTNSGILNHAFALMVDGGDYNGQTVSGIGLDKAGAVMYRTLTAYLTASSDFRDAGSAIRQACADLAGAGRVTVADCGEVAKALTAVELDQPFPCDAAVSVAKRGAGAGTVTSDPAGIDCGSACSDYFSIGTRVGLTATADEGSVFAGWRASCQNGNPAESECWFVPRVPGDVITAIATFDPAGTTHTANVVVQGNGTVTSSPAGLDCGATCAVGFPSGTSLTLTASPAAGYALLAWGGDCSGYEATCVVQMDAAKSVTATFGLPQFVGVSTPSLTRHYGCAEWGDYDNDGDLDLVIVASRVGGPATKLWRNDGGSFVDSGVALRAVSGIASWADYDNDGDLDLLLSGYVESPSSGYRTWLLRNDRGTFVAANGSLAAGERPAAAWGDYDSDGDLDLALTSGYELRIYRNDGSASFSIVDGPVPASGPAAWGDADGDGDLDLVVADRTGDGTRILRNDAGAFVSVAAGLAAVENGSVTWGDYDSDGDLDLLLTGYGLSAAVTKVYRNDSGALSDIGAPLHGISQGGAVWGDYDSDGDLDILAVGYLTGFSFDTRLYTNDAARFAERMSGLPASDAGAAWGDYDNDGRLDVLLPGGDMFAGQGGLYRNVESAVNTRPTAPTHLRHTVTPSACVLSWDPASDAETPTAGLTYNVRVGRTPAGTGILSPIADAATGFRKVVGLGNAGQHTSLTLRGLAPGRYYWAVQAIDASFAGSAFSANGEFLVPTPVTLSINDVAVNEGHTGSTSATFNVQLSSPAVQEVTVSYATVDGSATAESDYAAQVGSLVFAPGETARTVTVLVKGDTIGEPDETFSVALTDPYGATFARAQGQGTIVNDDVVTEEVVWTAMRGVTASGNDLTMTAASGWGHAGAVSTRAIRFGNGYVELVATEATTGRAIGLSHGNAGADLADIDFAVFLSASGALMVYEGGTSRGAFGSYVPGDVIRISVTGDVVRYSRNAKVLYESEQAPPYPLLVDAALRHTGATLHDVVLYGRLGGSPAGSPPVPTPTPPPTPTPTPRAVTTEEVVWTAASGVTVSGNDLTMTAASGWGHAGAVSTRAIEAGDGYVELVATEATTGRMIGLSKGDTSADYADIDFAAFMSANGALMIYEGGVSRGTFGDYAAGDVIRVAVVAGMVRYSRNAKVLYESEQAPRYPLLVDTALRHTGATLRDVVISGVLVGSPAGPAPSPTPSPPPTPISTEAVTWTAASGVTVSGNDLTMTATSGWGNAGAVSTRAIASGDGYVEFIATETHTGRIVGLSNGDTDASYEDVDFGAFLSANGAFMVYEAGVARGTFGSYAPGDVLRVAVVGGAVLYSRNGSVVYTSTQPPKYPVLVDAALRHTGATISDAVISGSLSDVETAPAVSR